MLEMLHPALGFLNHVVPWRLTGNHPTRVSYEISLWSVCVCVCVHACVSLLVYSEVLTLYNSVVGPCNRKTGKSVFTLVPPRTYTVCLQSIDSINPDIVMSGVSRIHAGTFL